VGIIETKIKALQQNVAKILVFT